MATEPRPEPDLPRRLGWRLAQARLALGWEALWPALMPAALVVGLGLALALFDVFAVLPLWAHIGLLALLALAAIGLALRGLARMRWPTREMALRRLETAGRLPHRPLATLADTPVGGAEGAASALWAAHLERARKAAARARAGAPRPDAARRDPLALRGAVVLALAAGLFVAGADAPTRLARALDIDLRLPAPPPAHVDAWVTPPAYTRVAPVFLTAGDAAIPDILDVPAGSVLTLRVSGGGEVALDAPGQEPVEADANASAPATETSIRETRLSLTADGTVTVTEAGMPRFAQAFAITPDRAPEVRFREEIGITQNYALRFVYAAEDDYGVERLEARISLDNAEAADPLVIPLPYSGERTAVTGETFRDLTPHPFAGLPVTVQILARDGGGNTGLSDPVSMVLPERVFMHEVARALVEQRKVLTLSPERRDKVAAALDAILLYPDGLFERVTPGLGIAVAAARLRADRSPEGLASVQAMLWEIALALEEGDASMALADLRAAQEALERALQEGASDEEISRLMDQLREAMNRYMQEMARQMMEALQRGEIPPQAMQPVDPNRMVDQNQLERMLDAIEDMARSGARESAQQLLNELRRMMENLQAGIPQPMQGQDQQMNEALQELSDIITEQQRLMDRTQRGERQGQGQMQQGEQQGGEGQQGRPRPGSGMGGMAQDQDALRRQLGELLSRLGEAGADLPQALGEAEGSMRGATDGLSENDRGRALGHQRDAIDQLRDGAQSLAQQLMDRMQQQQDGGQGQAQQRGTGRNGQEQDPLGRPRAQRGPDDGDSVRVPDERALQTVREILQELRRRAAEQDRPGEELEYLRRLLERF
ncbi:TIGR02302 family protein [Futiania mangrovi]|uniref:TIGR02302 family protein n=1 Tax=Futiania mangrovi TaxID=2959716 RepID=A0A9J6PER0_9PROT|nr:TIGR02302 family protein [Futiania mangrovii]MCP1336320.1 TIGR02302 family protein [Futiania mangrovii]